MTVVIYADYNATAPLRPQAREAMLAALGVGANPSSVHGPGRRARALREAAREQVAGAIGAAAQDLVFTSGGTEANALALQGLERAHEEEITLLVSAIEHEAVSRASGLSGARVETARVGSDGRLDLDALEARLKRWERGRDGLPVLALMLVNNETGVIQPVAEAARLVREAGGLTHCDAVQALGKIPVSVAMLGVDYLALSAHKTGGPQGIGALWVRPAAPLVGLQQGGGQERGLRSGTENLSGMAGFGAAAEASVRDLPAYAALAPLRDAMEARLEAEGGVTTFGRGASRVAGTSCFGRAGFRSETQVMAMDLAGVAVSAGAACSSGKVRRSLVLSAMGVENGLAESTIRASFGWASRPDDFTELAEAWLNAARRVKAKEQA